MSHHAPQDKKAKKKAQLAKNRFHQQFFNFIRMRNLEAERVEELAEALEKPKREEQEEEPAWMAKTASISNRLNNKKRLSNERWNRFAGTEGGGGRGL